MGLIYTFWYRGSSLFKFIIYKCLVQKISFHKKKNTQVYQMDMVLHGISESFSSAMHILKFLEMRSFEKEAAEVQGRTLYSITVVTFRNQKRMYTQLAQLLEPAFFSRTYAEQLRRQTEAVPHRILRFTELRHCSDYLVVCLFCLFVCLFSRGG